MTIAVIISSFLSGLLGAMGFGGGAVLIIYLTTFLSLEQKQAQGINLLFFLITGIFALVGNVRKGLVDKNKLPSFLLTALPGLVTGYLLLPITETVILKKLFGAFLILLGLKELFKKKEAPCKN